MKYSDSNVELQKHLYSPSGIVPTTWAWYPD